MAVNQNAFILQDVRSGGGSEGPETDADRGGSSARREVHGVVWPSPSHYHINFSDDFIFTLISIILLMI